MAPDPDPDRRPTLDTAHDTHVPSGAFGRIGAFCARRARLILLAWLVLVAVFGALAPRLPDALSPGGFEIAGSDSERTRSLILARFANETPSGLTVVMEVTGAAADPSAALRRAERRVRRAIAANPDLVGPVSSLVVAPDGRSAGIAIGLTAGLDDVLRRVSPLLDGLEGLSSADVIVRTTGGAAVFRDFDRVNAQDLRRAELIQVPLVLAVLVMVLGSLVAASIPLIATGATLAVTLGVLWLATHAVDMTLYVRSIVPLVGIGVTVDYSLFVVKRFREETDAGRGVHGAVVRAAETAGRAVFFSGLTVMVALAGMFAVGLPIFTAIAIGSVAVVAVAVAAALTLIPAILAVAGGRLGRLDPFRRLRRRVPARSPARMERWAVTVMRRPWRSLLLSCGVMLLLAAPALWLQLGSSGSSALPDRVPSLQAAEVIARAAGAGAVAPIRVVVDGGAGEVPPAVLDRVVRTIGADDEVIRTTGPRVADDGRAHLFEVIGRHADDAPESHALVERIRAELGPAATRGTAVTVHSGGAPAQNVDFNAAVAQSLPRVIAAVMLLTFLVLVVLFRSLLLPLKAVVSTLLSVLVAYGVLVAVFQWGWGAGLLGIEAPGHVTAWVPPFLFSIVFGLSMDYEVFLLTRVRERLDAGGDDRAAVAWGIARSGPIITAAAAIMVIVFLSFVSNRLIPIKEAAIGLAVAVAVDATLVRVVLVPAFMVIAGRWNWWVPRWLDRVLPARRRVDPEEAPAR